MGRLVGGGPQPRPVRDTELVQVLDGTLLVPETKSEVGGLVDHNHHCFHHHHIFIIIITW